MRRRFANQIEDARTSIVCPFCDHEIRSRGNVVRCLNCGGCFEREPDEEEFLFGTGSGF